MDAVKETQFKSSTKKLATFFQRSRDNWKAKYLRKRDENILLSNKVRAVQKSRKHWRDVAENAKKDAQQLRAEARQLKEQIKKASLAKPIS